MQLWRWWRVDTRLAGRAHHLEHECLLHGASALEVALPLCIRWVMVLRSPRLCSIAPCSLQWAVLVCCTERGAGCASRSCTTSGMEINLGRLDEPASRVRQHPDDVLGEPRHAAEVRHHCMAQRQGECRALRFLAPSACTGVRGHQRALCSGIACERARCQAILYGLDYLRTLLDMLWLAALCMMRLYAFLRSCA